MSSIPTITAVSYGTPVKTAIEPNAEPTDQPAPAPGIPPADTYTPCHTREGGDRDDGGRDRHENHKGISHEAIAKRFWTRAQRLEDRVAELREKAEGLTATDPDRAAKLEHRAARLEAKADRWMRRAEKFGFVRPEPTPLPGVEADSTAVGSTTTATGAVVTDTDSTTTGSTGSGTTDTQIGGSIDVEA